jgi:hypothetical protein
VPTFIRPAKVVVSDDGLDATAILAALAALALAAAAVWFVLANIVLVGLLLAVFAVVAAAIVFVAWKYGPQLAGFRYLRSRPAPAVRARVVRAAVLPSLPAPAPAAIAPAVQHISFHYYAAPQPEGVPAVHKAITEQRDSRS